MTAVATERVFGPVVPALCAGRGTADARLREDATARLDCRGYRESLRACSPGTLCRAGHGRRPSQTSAFVQMITVIRQ
jgi:hypothetical protein